MKNFSVRAKAFVLATLVVGALLAYAYLVDFSSSRIELLIAASVVAAIFQTLKIEGSTARSSYNLSWVIYGATFFLLGAPQAYITILVAHVVEWIWHRYPWYIQGFNIASFAVAVAGADVSQDILLRVLPEANGLNEAVAILVSMAVFTAVNHWMVGMVIWLARGQNMAQSGVLGFTTLAIDFGLLCLGASAVLIGAVNPYAVVLIAIVIYLLYSVLKIPALERKSELEPKTGLYNAQFFDQALEKEVARSQKLNQPMSVVMADLDLLRDINNNYGHLAGDAVIKKIAQILQALARDNDIVSRFGGEEYAILMPDTRPDEAVILVEAMRRAIEAAEFTLSANETPIKATMSFGIAGRIIEDRSPKELVHDADLAVYRAKHTGRNRVCLYGQENESLEPLQFENDEVIVEEDTIAASPINELPPATAKHSPSGSVRKVNLFIGAMVVTAGGLLALLLPVSGPIDWYGLLVFTLLALVLEAFATNIYTKETSVSTSVTALMAGTLGFGLPGALVTSAIISIVTQVRIRKPLNRLVFNLCNHLIGSLILVMVVQYIGAPYQSWPAPTQVLIAILAAGIMFAVTTGLLSGIVSMDSGRSMGQVWSENFKWLGLHYIGMGLVTFALLFNYLSLGTLGVLVLVVPLSMLYISQRQYIYTTKTMVDRLRSTNSELELQTEEVHTLNEELLLALASTIDLRDPFVVEHSRHVARYAVLVAIDLGLSPEKVELVRQAGLMHDIGKLAIPEAILFKPDRLTGEEYAIVKDHVSIGADLLTDFHSLRKISSFVRYHHERYDGHGYPDGLAGEEIPIEARILALADAVEAMASDRPYRTGSTTQDILTEVKIHAGTQFDPAVVRAFERVIEREDTPTIINSARNIEIPERDAGPMLPEAVPVWPDSQEVNGEERVAFYDAAELVTEQEFGADSQST